MDAGALTASDERDAAAVTARVTLRMFAAARQAAGVASLPVEAATVAGAIEAGTAAFGPAWAEVAASSRTWVNGDPAAADRALVDGDEVAVLPPVSGGQA